MRTTFSVLMACGLLGVASGAANADGGIRIKIGGIGIRVGPPPAICPPAPCPPPPCPPVVCHEPRYREEVVWETVPQTEVWYDACGIRHERTIYVRQCRTIRVPIDPCEPVVHHCDSHCDHHHGDWRGQNGSHGNWRDGWHRDNWRERNEDDRRDHDGRDRDRRGGGRHDGDNRREGGDRHDSGRGDDRDQRRELGTGTDAQRGGERGGERAGSIIGNGGRSREMANAPRQGLQPAPSRQPTAATPARPIAKAPMPSAQAVPQKVMANREVATKAQVSARINRAGK